MRPAAPHGLGDLVIQLPRNVRPADDLIMPRLDGAHGRYGRIDRRVVVIRQRLRAAGLGGALAGIEDKTGKGCAVREVIGRTAYADRPSPRPQSVLDGYIIVQIQ